MAEAKRRPEKGRGRKQGTKEKELDEELEDTFPASDPPAATQPRPPEPAPPKPAEPDKNK